MKKKTRKTINKVLKLICGVLVFLGVFVSIGAIGSTDVNRITDTEFWNLQLQAFTLILSAIVLFIIKQYFLYLTKSNRK
jgi:phosphate/sulfate permease